MADWGPKGSSHLGQRSASYEKSLAIVVLSFPSFLYWLALTKLCHGGWRCWRGEGYRPDYPYHRSLGFGADTVQSQSQTELDANTSTTSSSLWALGAHPAEP